MAGLYKERYVEKGSKLNCSLNFYTSMPDQLIRCWEGKDEPIQISYHDLEWGVPLHDDNKLFEFLALGGFQAGLSWWIILKRREDFRKAFDYFDPMIVSRYTMKDSDRLMNTKSIIRNKAKIEAVILNAKQFLKVQAEFGSFDKYIWQFVNDKPIINNFKSPADLPAETVESRKMSKLLRNRGFTFVGPTICYAFMQATGMVNDHLINCFRHEQLVACT